uniref:Dynein axonemal heavy chain 17 n=1 Tax=Ficedula albicollis TaxID=59894 RepID=A0A803WAD3_FICAL
GCSKPCPTWPWTLPATVLVPILTNRRNHQGWPRVVSQDIIHHVHSLRNTVFKVVGQVKGKTLLPLPAVSEGIENLDPKNEKFLELINKSLVHATESAIIDWSQQIQRVLKKESSEPLLQGTNPTPKVELEFWKSRCADLEGIYSQLTSRRVSNMLEVLERVQSIYVPAFQNMLLDVQAALSEAQDIDLHLTALQQPLEDIEAVEFSRVKPLLVPLLHVVCWIWVTSKHYGVPVRIVVLLQEICNLLIQQAVLYLSPEDLLKGEMEESLGKVQTVLGILSAFKGAFEERRENLHVYCEPGQELRSWDFHSRLVFARLDSFLQRLQTVKGLLTTALDLTQLEKIELGGMKGKALAQQVLDMYEEFQEGFQVFSERSYDCLDLANVEFEQDALGFQQRVEDIDRRLATVFSQAFSDAPGLEHVCKLLAMFQNLLERPGMAAVAADKVPVLLSMFSTALDQARLMQCCSLCPAGFPPLHKNVPPVAGALGWARELRAPQSGLGFHSVTAALSGLVTTMWMFLFSGRYQEKLYLDWSQTVSEKSQYNLSQPLLRRDPQTKLLSVNFDPQLVSVLREVSYLQGSGAGAIPPAAAAIYSCKESFQQLVASLELLGNKYNRVLRTVLEVEYPLVQGQLQDIDLKLREAEETLTWKMEGELEMLWWSLQRVQKAKENVEEIQSIVQSWESPILERRDPKKESVLSLEECQECLERRCSLVRDSGHRIHCLVQENQSLLLAEPASDAWKVYLDYVDEIVLDGFFTAIECSLKYLLESTDPEAGLAPLFEVQLDLVIPDLVFHPPLDPGTNDGFCDMVENLLQGIFHISSLVPRLAVHSGLCHYQADLEAMPGLCSARQELLSRARAAAASCCEHRAGLERFSHLFGEDRREQCRQLLLCGRSVPADMEPQPQDGVPAAPPSLQQIREQLGSYERLHEEVAHLQPVCTFQGWLRLDARPFRAALLNEIKRWSLVFKQHLLDHVTHSLADLDEFIQTTEKGLSRKVEEGDSGGLVEVMGHLLAVKERHSATDAMFEPLKETIELLRDYEQELPEEVHQQLEELPEQWSQVKKLAEAVRQQVAPLQAGQVSALRQSCAAFDARQLQLRQRFGTEAPFRYCGRPGIKQMESAMTSIYESAGLFEVVVPEYKQLKQCRKELCLLKELWDMISLVNSSLDDWQSTRWVDINVENMDLECKKFAREIRSLDKEMRAWDAFSGLDSKVKNMLTALKAVAELQNPAIRERHWKQLMQATGVRFVMDSDTTLADLLRLNLHEFEGEVHGIVDKAVREMSMEKVLKELRVTWSSREFQYEPHPRTSIPLLKSDEELIETLEDNQVQLQNLMSSKYIAFFLEEVSAWQRKLSTADSVISLWFEVQRTWSHLESIFIGSGDIRAQLPQDSRRFDGIDVDFKELAYEVQKTPNVVEATNKPGLSQLSLCEKALAEYLDMKRLAFPRFYFISSADLLDILSNGTNPQLVQRHLPKLFDNLAKLKFQVDSEQKTTKVGLGMYSREEEYVQFSEPCDCSGQVRGEMPAWERHTMPKILHVSYEPSNINLSRNSLFYFLTIWWTAEVGMAFSRMKEGYEKAMKEYHKKQVAQLNMLVTMLLGQLSKGDRQKIMTICTIDVHARDVVAKMIVDSGQAFLWLSQLRHRWADEERHCWASICDAQFLYSYEYLGNTPRLVITPLTDRCYITLTQSLHLTMSGAPAGPAGTGKTETTKDLGRALGIMVYVFNCSEQMDYKSCGNIYKGLSQTGAWGCFDEFNRISVEVLSVVAVQVKSVQDAIREKKKSFNFLGEDINLVPSVGIFITMNPGYAGRTELPENLKALFRPCAMVVPDFELICEIMLVAEGFLEARALARKFITLYQLCKELLSKQDHYDWGLRAIKSVLVVAGSLKRAEPGRPEEQVLMRSLRDFNVPKLVTDDMPVFLGLLGDLFPALDVPRKRDLRFEAVVKEAVLELRLQPEDNFVLKVVQLEELLSVRHSVFVVGAAGTGKSQVLRSLHRSYQRMKRRPVWADLNPKAVTNDELFGIINPATREWRDGLFSSIMRELANISHDGPKWMVLDGDIDPMWIESLNTVMDDNKVLTLASNERIPLNPSMRLLFEISHLRSATPATVSRAGILYINPSDLGWNAPVSSWIDRREVQSERANLTILFDKYLPVCLDTLRSRFKKIIPIPEQSMVQMLCYLLECLLTEDNTPPDCPKELYELYFVFAAVWAFGGSMFQDQLVDYRVEFSKWWVAEFKTIKFPSQGTVFDYYVDPETKKLEPWSKLIPQFEFDPEVPLQGCLVPTARSVCLRFLVARLLQRRRPVLLVGTAGTGKSVLLGDTLCSLDTHLFLLRRVPFNYYTTSAVLQGVLEKPLEKKAGRNYGPPGSKRLVYFIDDLNAPRVDAYGTVQPHTLLRQHLDYGHWYDRSRLSLKEISNVQFVSCMNPTAGSFTINPRLQRHFCVFALSNPDQEALSRIYSTILGQHLASGNFSEAVQKSAQQLIALALGLHRKVAATFLPTAVKFHYVFNLRDFSNIFQGLLFSTPECVKQPQDLVKLYLHESSRVYRDRMAEDTDCDTFDKIQREMVKKCYGDSLEQAKHMNIYCHFAKGLGEPGYRPVPSWEELNQILVEALDSYNEVNAAMNLVLFEDAMCHVCRISRILEAPRGHALLVGVGGSGKQSLTRLAAFISNLETFQITLRKGYGLPDLKADLASLYLKAGLKGVGSVFLLSDAQLADEQFLVLVNDFLASGEIPDLFPDDEVENIISSVRNEVRARGLLDSRENCWSFFIERVRRRLKVVLCLSPVGPRLRLCSRRFPALAACSTMDSFQPWPRQALESVSRRFLRDMDTLQDAVKDSISKFMAHVHISVNEVSRLYLSNEHRYNYTTPKSFLEQIKLYQSLLLKKDLELKAKMERLESGLEKLKSTSAQVDELKAKLAAQEVELKQKNEDADRLIQVVGLETEKVSRKKAVADEEERKVALITQEVEQKQRDCEEDLAKAEPALAAAQAALNTLNKTNLTELRSFGSPPAAVSNVTARLMVLTAPGGRIPKDRSWKAAKVAMARVDGFLDSLINFNKENIHENCLKALQPYLQDPKFNPEFVATKSAAAAGLCSWVLNIARFHRLFCQVQPKRQALHRANAELAAAQDKLATVKAKIARLNENLGRLTARFEQATSDKLKCQQEAEATACTITLANRLVGGLASENVRWAEAVKDLKEQQSTLCGDVLLSTAFVSYLGYFTSKYRQDLLDGIWRPYLHQLKVPVPVRPGLDPLWVLADAAAVAAWQNQGLPSDRASAESAAILRSCQRWPLVVDPQLQGSRWIRASHGERLRLIRAGHKGYLDTLEQALAAGDVVLIENLEESVDPVLGPLLGRETIKKGRYIKIGDKECALHPAFRLILHTKLANPHFQPELQAQCTLIDFSVTRHGLEEQLLGAVVRLERPDLEELKSDLTKQQNGFKITLKTLEDNLLSRLSSASGNFLGDTELVENLETTKRTAAEIVEKVQEFKVTEARINEAREQYRPAACRAALLYFTMSELHAIHPMYQFSLKAFHGVFQKAIERAAPADSLPGRVLSLTDSITFSVFQYTARGLFERDKLTFSAQLTFQILLMNKEINPAELDFLLRYPAQPGVTSPVEFLSDHSWGGIKALSSMEEFKNLDRDIEGSAKRWKKFVESECPERERFPQDWKNKSALQRLCIMRALRPDRLPCALRDFVEEKLGSKYVVGRSLDFATTFEESGPATPIFFILSPGVDPLKDVEKHGKKLGYTFNHRNLHNISLGQGQEVVAEQALDLAAKEGHWVILQVWARGSIPLGSNIHLVAKWLSSLEQRLEQLSEGSQQDFRVFLSAEPAPCPGSRPIPQGILENSLKITSEAPSGVHANLHRALDNFSQDTLEMCSQEKEFRSILFALCYFHAVAAERRKFGPQGWNRPYPFSSGDLTISVSVLHNCLRASSKVPYDDLRYLVGEIMYGGHITDDWDRRLCRTYLEEFIRPEMLEGELCLAPGFPLPGNMDYNGYHQYIDDALPPESPHLYGLHPNAEIGFLTQRSERLLRTVLELQPRGSSTGQGALGTREEMEGMVRVPRGNGDQGGDGETSPCLLPLAQVQALLEEMLEKLTDEFNMAELVAKVEERTPYAVVALQECERMNALTAELRRSLSELELGLKGELTMSSDMEALQNSLFLGTVPESWLKRSYPSTASLGSWFADLLARISELEAWTRDFSLPCTLWLGGFFNPQAMLTAVMQTAARRNKWPLDTMTLQCDVTKKSREDFASAPREGAYVHGLFMEGARWDVQAGSIADARLQELTPAMPVLFIKAIPGDKQDSRALYPCPLYRTRQRGPTYVWTLNLKTKESPSKWVLAGVALLLQI